MEFEGSILCFSKSGRVTVVMEARSLQVCGMVAGWWNENLARVGSGSQGLPALLREACGGRGSHFRCCSEAMEVLLQ